MFDTVCKFLVEHFSEDFATWLLGKPVELTELSPTELSLEPPAPMLSFSYNPQILSFI
jgi:predicted transposase YdaD